MQTQRSIIQLADRSLQRVDFDPLTFRPEDLLWLPHHARLTGCARKRQSEHLAGRIAAVYALREVGETEVPAIGDQRQPLWPPPWYGSISHCERSALAVVSVRPIGVDIERILTPDLAAELESCIINSAEKVCWTPAAWAPSWRSRWRFRRKRARLRPAIPTYRRASVLAILRWRI